ncbi:MAG: nuclear transport factor 2 family protein [Gemmatimonadaceae bacterium]
MRRRVQRVRAAGLRIALASLALGAGCRGLRPGGAAQREVPPEQVVRDYLVAYNRHDVPAVLALLDPTVAWLSIEGDSVRVEARGLDAMRRGLEAYFRNTLDARSVAETMTSLGPWVTVRERAYWRSGRTRRSQAAMSVYEVRNGRIRRVWYYPVVR